MPLGAEQHAVPLERLCCFPGICILGDMLSVNDIIKDFEVQKKRAESIVM